MYKNNGTSPRLLYHVLVPLSLPLPSQMVSPLLLGGTLDMDLRKDVLKYLLMDLLSQCMFRSGTEEDRYLI